MSIIFHPDPPFLSVSLIRIRSGEYRPGSAKLRSTQSFYPRPGHMSIYLGGHYVGYFGPGPVCNRSPPSQMTLKRNSKSKNHFYFLHIKGTSCIGLYPAGYEYGRHIYRTAASTGPRRRQQLHLTSRVHKKKIGFELIF